MATRILVVDDELAIREVLRELLEDEGHHVMDAAHGLAALEVVAATPPDLIITDLWMPELDGAGLAHELRSRGHGMPVLVLSAAIRARPPAGLPFLTKPFEPDVLLATVARLLAQHRSPSGSGLDAESARR